MRFSAHERLLEILVGQNLYTNADVAVRELLQNAEDACDLQGRMEEDFQPAIELRYSVSKNIIEVSDNGLGMDDATLQGSFLQIGAHKTEVPKIAALLKKSGKSTGQIAQFGIGILSCFGIASMVEVRTKADDHDAIAFRIPALRAEFEALPDKPIVRGTTITLHLSPGGPMNAADTPAAANKYSRYAPHISIVDLDNNTRSQLAQSRSVEADAASTLADQALLVGSLNLDAAWENLSERYQSRLLMCNGGFVVNEKESELLRKEAFGYVGEFDVRPGALNILMNREGFKRDEAWHSLAERSWEHYLKCIAAKISDWESRVEHITAGNLRPAVERSLLLLTRGNIRNVLGEELLTRSQALLRQVFRVKLATGGGDLSLQSALNAGQHSSVLYYVEEGEGEREFTQSLSSEGSSFQVREVALTRGLRSTLLSANGYSVLSLRRSQFAVDVGKETTTITVRDFDVLQESCAAAGVNLTPVENAPDTHTHLGDRPEGRVIGHLFQLSEELKLAALPNPGERVVRDFNGRLLNISNPEVRDIIRLIPNTVGNPVRREILKSYLDLSTFNFEGARLGLVKLLTDEDFDEKAQLLTGTLLKSYLEERINSLLGDQKTE